MHTRPNDPLAERGDQRARPTAKVCVVIPTHNRHGQLQTALDSVLVQSYHNLHVVVVDEGSHPPVLEVLGPDDPRITVLRNEEALGPAAARNQGSRAAASDFVAFLDDDDFWLPTKLERCLASFETYPAAGTVFHKVAFPSDHRDADGHVVFYEDPTRRMLLHQPPHVDAVVVRREIHDRVLFDETFPAAADLDYMLRLASAAPMVELNEVLAVHGTPSQQGTSISLEKRILGRKQFYDKHRDLFDRHAASFFNYRLGHLYRRSGDRSAAVRAFGRAWFLRPLDPRIWKWLLVSSIVPASIIRRSKRAA